MNESNIAYEVGANGIDVLIDVTTVTSTQLLKASRDAVKLLSFMSTGLSGVDINR